MSTETWQPATKTVEPIASETLVEFAANADNAAKLIQEAKYQSLAYLMKQPLAFWQAPTEGFDETQLWQLMQFFALAEEASGEWFAGEHSPVTHLNKILKARGAKLDKEQLLWLRENSSNRFLPNGPIVL